MHNGCVPLHECVKADGAISSFGLCKPQADSKVPPLIAFNFFMIGEIELAALIVATGLVAGGVNLGVALVFASRRLRKRE
jgi:hypothetical protein